MLENRLPAVEDLPQLL